MPKSISGFSGNPLHPVEAALWVAQTIKREWMYFGDHTHALAAYNWGHGHLIRNGIERAPKETRDFIQFFISRGILPA
jgi:hypothetical protein